MKGKEYTYSGTICSNMHFALCVTRIDIRDKHNAVVTFEQPVL